MTSATQLGLAAPSVSKVSSYVLCTPPAMSSTASSFTPRHRFAPTGTGETNAANNTSTDTWYGLVITNPIAAAGDYTLTVTQLN